MRSALQSSIPFAPDLSPPDFPAVEMRGDVIEIEGRAGESARDQPADAGRSGLRRRSRHAVHGRNVAFASASPSAEGSASTAPSAHRARPPARDQPRGTTPGRPSDSDRSSDTCRPAKSSDGHRACGGSPRRPPIRSDADGMRATSSRLFSSYRRKPRRDHANARVCGKTSRICPPAQRARSSQRFLGRTLQEFPDTKMQDVARYRDRPRPGARCADKREEHRRRAVGETFDHVRRRQEHDQPHILV